MSDDHTEHLKRIPSVRALQVFEAVGRHLNIVRAAEELGVTQSALSRQIKGLEAALKIQLFRRGPRGLTFTEAGDLLFDHARRAFTELDRGVGRLVGRKTRQTLVISVARSFAARALPYRIGEFCQRFPWIDVRIDGHRYFSDLSRDEADVSIRAGDGVWPGFVVKRITNSRLFPVAAPAIAHGERPIRKVTDLTRHPLLHYAERPYWKLWLAATGDGTLVDGRKGLRFDDSAIMLEVAEAGHGIAIARSCLVENALAHERLVQLFNVSVEDGVDYYLAFRPEKQQRSTVTAFSEWMSTGLFQESQATDGPGEQMIPSESRLARTSAVVAK